MINSESLTAFNSFEDEIESFKISPEKYEFPLKNRLLRQLYNGLKPFLIWFCIAFVLNLLGVYLFIHAPDPITASSLLAMIALLITILTRNYTLNYILFDLLGNLGKNYLLHQLVNRIGFMHRFGALSTLGWFGVHLYHLEYSVSFFKYPFSLWIDCSIINYSVKCISYISKEVS